MANRTTGTSDGSARLDDLDPATVTDLLQTLADGRSHDVTPIVDRLRPTHPLLADVVAADAAARLAETTVPDLRALHRRALDHAPDEPVLAWWVVAVMGERAFLDADLGVVPLAITALAEVPADPYAPPVVLFVRARLRRIASALYLVDPSPERLAEHLALRDAAVADLLRCDLVAEAALTRGLSAALLGIAAWEDVGTNLEVLRDARALLGEPEGSVWLPILAHLQTLLAVAGGYLDAATEAAALVERHRHEHPVFAAFADHATALVDLVASAGSDESIAAMAGALEALARSHPHLLPLTQLQAAHALADHGRADAARRFGVAGLTWPPARPVTAHMNDLLRLRFDLLDGLREPDDLDQVRHHIERIEALGHRRHAGVVALRVARDLERAGRDDEAAELRAWGVERLPDPRRRTPFEQRLSRPLVDVGGHQSPTGSEPAPAGADPAHDTARVAGTTAAHDPRVAVTVAPSGPTGVVAPTVTVAVLAPIVEVTCAGEPVRLRDMAAKLLVALLAALPEPLHAEQAIDALWPDADADVGRGRLNTVVHRLRTSLGLPASTLRRTGDVLLLDPAGWQVDLLTLRQALDDLADPALGTDEQLARLHAATRPVRGNLAHVQFPYDDALADRRLELVGEVERAARRGARASGSPEVAAALDHLARRLDPHRSP